MAKNSITKKNQHQEFEDEFDFSDMIGLPYDDDMMPEVIGSMIEASNNQMKLAVELTRIAIEKMTKQNITEEDVFSVYKKASMTINDTSPLKSFWEKMPIND